MAATVSDEVMLAMSDEDVEDDDVAHVVRMSKAKRKSEFKRATIDDDSNDEEQNVERGSARDGVSNASVDEADDHEGLDANADESGDEETRRIQSLVGKGKGVSMRAPPKKRKMSKAVLERKFKSEAKRLSTEEVNTIVQFIPFKRLVKNSLDYGVSHVSSVSVQVLMEAAVSYLHDLYEESWKISTVSSNQKTLMMRHVSGLLFAKRISHLPQCDDDDDDAED